MSPRLGLVGIALCAVLAGCATEKSPSTATRYSADFTGAAKGCIAPKDLQVPAGKTNEVTITVINDGGWCALTVDRDGKPYDLGLLTSPPTHGKVFIHKVGDDTRIDYTPDRGFTGDDKFALTLKPTGATLAVIANVSR